MNAIESRAFRERLERDSQPVVKTILNLYGIGDIVTQEECLCQMVIALNRQVNALQSDLLQYVARSGPLPPYPT